MPPNEGHSRLEDALVVAFSLEGLKRMARRHLGLILEHELNLQQGTKFIAGDLVALAVRDGWRDELVQAALAENPGNLQLVRAAEALNVATQPPPTPALAAGALPNLDRGNLEKLVRERGVFLKWQDFSRKMASLGRTLCRIEVPRGSARGTGWLVGPDLVLTNYHVIEDVRRNGVAAADVTCRFDYFEEGVGGVECDLDAAWLVGSSPAAGSDVRADLPEPTMEELDFALLRLSRPLGGETVDERAAQRGWLRVSASPPVVVADDILLVPQFPDGRSLELTFGKALAYNGNGTRLRHDANTLDGASGSPCVTVSLEPFALHHASGPGRALRYNQCVPLRLVLKKLAEVPGLIPFWQA